MKLLDGLLIKEFEKQVKAGLAGEDKSILQTCGSVEAWASAYMERPPGMGWVEFYAYTEVVGENLVVQNVLKVDRRKHRGMSEYNPSRLRISRSWYNKANEAGYKVPQYAVEAIRELASNEHL